MDYNRNYNRCRQFIPPGWGSARTLAPCNRLGRSIAFRVTECKPSQSCPVEFSPVIVAKQGGNNAQGGSGQRNQTCSPCSTKAPINVHLKMCPVPDNQCQANGRGFKRNQAANSSASQPSSSMNDPFFQQCTNACPLPRCPPGIRVERTLPIVPIRRIQESYFKMPSTSVYKSDYVPRKLERTKSFAPEMIAVESSGEFQQESLSKSDYKPMPVCPYKKPPWAFSKPREENLMKLDGISRYKIDYVPKQVAPALSAKPVRFLDAAPALMDDRSIYQVDYIKHPLEPCLEKLTDAQILAEITNTCVPFDGLTIYKRDYIPKQSKPAQSVLDKEKALMKPLEAMEGTTTYKASFNPFYFGDMECIPAEIYDQMYPPKDKCCQVRCCPEAERQLENPVQPPVPPCRPCEEQSYCPTPSEMRCAPRVVPCVSPYKLKKEMDPCTDCTTIRVEPNVRECQNEPVEIVCPAQPCKSFA